MHFAIEPNNMGNTLSAERLNEITEPLREAMREFARRYPGETGRRRPVHTVYGGAHLFRANTAAKLGELALRYFEAYAPDAQSFADVLDLPLELKDVIYHRVREKLVREPVEDLRIDFEDGYGTRSDTEEDGHAIAAAREVANGLAANALTPFIGIRIKPFSEELLARTTRTLDLFLTTLAGATGGNLPTNFVVTLPKIVACEQVATLADIFDEIETPLGLAAGTLKMEMMVETTQSIIAADGSANLPRFLQAARGRCTGAHFGAYDHTASCSITAAYQDMLHPSCDFARNMMQVAFGGTGVWLSDGATNILPIAPHRGENLTLQQMAENKKIVHRAWRLHYDHCRSSLANGFYQGWDLHPAQLPTRYAAVYTFFLEGLDAASERLCNFIERAAQATLVGDVFDDAATGQGLLNYFLRAINCGAITEDEAVSRTGITLDELRAASFIQILTNRQY